MPSSRFAYFRMSSRNSQTPWQVRDPVFANDSIQLCDQFLAVTDFVPKLSDLRVVGFCIQKSRILSSSQLQLTFDEGLLHDPSRSGLVLATAFTLLGNLPHCRHLTCWLAIQGRNRCHRQTCTSCAPFLYMRHLSFRARHQYLDFSSALAKGAPEISERIRMHSCCGLRLRAGRTASKLIDEHNSLTCSLQQNPAST